MDEIRAPTHAPAPPYVQGDHRDDLGLLPPGADFVDGLLGAEKGTWQDPVAGVRIGA